MIICGAKQIDITPPIGIPLAGYGARLKGSEGIHDSLNAQLVYLSDTSNEVLFIGLDLVAIDADFTTQVRARLNRELGIPETSILLACTHTHSGPDGYANAFPREKLNINDSLRQNTIDKIAGAALWTKSSARPATISYGSERITGIGLNRNDPNKEIDNELAIVRIDVEEKPLTVLVNFACHPTVMGADNLQISADLPGTARKFFRIHYPTTIFMFMNGAAGDVSTRFMRRTQGFEELDRFGSILFGASMALMQKTQSLADAHITCKCLPIDLPIRNFPSEKEAKEALKACEDDYLLLKNNSVPQAELRKAETKIQGARIQAQFAVLLKETKTVRSEIQVIQLGNLFIITIPGEPFSGISLAIKASFPNNPVFVVGYANDYMGYFPFGVQEQTYETLKSPWISNIGDFLVRECISIIHSIQESEPTGIHQGGGQNV